MNSMNDGRKESKEKCCRVFESRFVGVNKTLIFSLTLPKFFVYKLNAKNVRSKGKSTPVPALKFPAPHFMTIGT
jgi:hypothetical protein